MSYQVLARKWRPKRFDQVVGQEHVLKALMNGLTQGRIHHAYLFAGTRGVGKTTLARIFAKCLNCESGVTAEPCGTCSACTEIDSGRFIDLIEVDAASRTKVEDTRELLENVQYAPTSGRYKVYLIDEVHMLSGHSFNALLKTLEEPPPHVKFLLATTDPQKLPITVLSRCLQFNLKRIPAHQISNQLQIVIDQEKVEAEAVALKEIAMASDGSMRDALSLLDQAIAFSGGSLTEKAITEMLGTVSKNCIYELVSSLAQRDAKLIINKLHSLADLSIDFYALIDDLIALFYQIALVQEAPELLSETEYDEHYVKEFASKLSKEDTQLFYQIALITKRDLGLMSVPQRGIEMMFLRMLSFSPVPVQESAEQSKNYSTDQITSLPPLNPSCDSLNLNQLRAEPEKWRVFVRNLDLKGVSASLAANSSIKMIAGNELNLIVSKEHEFICTDSAKNKLEQAIKEYTKEPVSLRIEIGEHALETLSQVMDKENLELQKKAQGCIEQDEVVAEFKNRFGAQIIQGSIKPSS